jgi:hypothetical protein
MYLRAYSFDFNTQKTYDLTNFYFDISDSSTQDIIQYTNPPILFQEKLWGKEIRILIPSLYEISGQRKLNVTTANSVNYNLTGGIGMSQLSPIFFEFSFITGKQTINSITTYNLASKVQLSLPQVPEFQTLGVKIQHSVNGDFFEIFGIYNNTIADFKIFMDNSVYLGNRYYIQYNITLYEQNIRGKTLTVTQMDNFNENVEYRPIIKYSTTTAVVSVDMYIIDAVDNSQIVRSASYGMLQDEVSKYSLNLTKINLQNAHKPKVYNLKSTNSSGILGLDSTTLGSLGSMQVSATTNIQTVKVPYAVLMSQYNIVAKSDSVIVGASTFYGDGKLVLLLKPFDNVIKIVIASQVTTQNDTITPQYLDMTSLGQIQMVFKNSSLSSSFELYQNTGEIDLANGSVVFLIPTNKIGDIRKIYQSGINVFYITSTQQNVTTVIYSGLYKLYDSTDNVNNLNAIANLQILNGKGANSTIISDNSANTGVAIVTRVLTQNSNTLAVDNINKSVSAINLSAVKNTINVSAVASSNIINRNV